MKKEQNYYTILITLIQTLKKFKTKFIFFSKKRNKQIFLEFLWLNQFIYGFTYLTYTKLIIFLKYNKVGNQLILKKIKKTYRLVNLQKMHNWSKNTFLIIKTKYGLSTINSTIKCKIGGFVFYKIC